MERARLRPRPFLSKSGAIIGQTCRRTISLSMGAGYFQSDSIESGPCAQIESLSVVAAPCHVVRVLRRNDRAEVFGLGRDDPYPVGACDVQIALLVDLHAVEGRRAWRGSHIEEDFAFGERSFRLHLIPHDYLMSKVPIVDIEIFLVWREGEAIGAFQIGCEQANVFAIRAYAKHSAVGQFFAGIIRVFGQAEWRIGKVKRAVGFVDQIVGAVEPLAVVAVREHGQPAILFHAHHTAVSLLIDREAALTVERETVGARLAVLADVRAAIAAVRHEDGKRTILGPAIDDILVWIAEEQIAIFVLVFGTQIGPSVKRKPPA